MNKLAQITDWPERALVAKYCVKSLAQKCQVSLRTLERHIKLQYGMCPQDWINLLLVRRAQELLPTSDSIKAVALELGYKHPHHFARDFKKYAGLTPSQFLTSFTPVRGTWIELL